MRWVGLTGGLGTGKSTVSRILRKKGYQVVDADQIARDVVAPGTSGLESVVKVFGSQILDSNGNLNRQWMAQEIFFDRDKKRKLERILHPLIRKEVEKLRKLFNELGESLAFYDIPLLFETNSKDQFELVLMVSCSADTQLRRIKGRNPWTDKEIQARLAAQLPLAKKEGMSDYVIRNDGSLKELSVEVEKALHWLLEK
jgi:dephospho-CoA kinase